MPAPPHERFTVPGHPTAIGHAQRRLAQWTAEVSAPVDTTRTAMVLLSALLARTVRHSGGDLVVDLRLHPHALHVQLSDPSPRPPRRRTVGDDAVRDAFSDSAMGVLTSLSHEWGVQRSSTATTVWFTLLLPPVRADVRGAEPAAHAPRLPDDVVPTQQRPGRVLSGEHRRRSRQRQAAALQHRLTLAAG
jgi:hypothetical protein